MVLLLAFAKYIWSQRNRRCTQNWVFWYFSETGNSHFMTKNCSVFLYLCIYFVQKIAELVLERLPLLGNGCSYRVVRPLVELHF